MSYQRLLHRAWIRRIAFLSIAIGTVSGSSFAQAALPEHAIMGEQSRSVAQGSPTNVDRSMFASVILGGSLFFSAPQEGMGKAFPSSTAIPVVFTQSIDASKAKVGDAVTAKTIQIVSLPDGSKLPKGATVLGHVTAAHAFSFDPTPYAAQQPSFLSVQFDRVVLKGATIPVSVSVRAMANSIESEEASKPRHTNDTDSVGTMVQIGGDTFSPLETAIFNSEGDVVAYNRRNGVFARLLPAEYASRYSHLTCDGANAEQSVAIFSASACGLYGFDSVYMTENGANKDQDTLRLESRRHTVKVYAQSAALLQVVILSGSNSQ
jgi:hypothetical protein